MLARNSFRVRRRDPAEAADREGAIPSTRLDTIDVFDQERYLDGPPYADSAVLRRQAPVFHHRDPEVPEGHWALTRHADIVHVARYPELFSSERKGFATAGVGRGRHRRASV